MSIKGIHPAALGLTVILIIFLGQKAASGCVSHRNCYCEERGLVCLCPIFSCPQCASHDDFQEEDRAADILFQLSNIVPLFQSVSIVTQKYPKPRMVFLEVPENPPRIF